MPKAVPGERSDPVVLARAEALEHTGEPASTTLRLAVRAAVAYALLETVGHHLAVAVMTRGERQQGRDQQRSSLHETPHECLPGPLRDGGRLLKPACRTNRNSADAIFGRYHGARSRTAGQ